MRRLLFVLIALLAASLVGLVFGQEVLPPELVEVGFNPAVWFASAGAFALPIFSIVGFVKEHVLTTLSGWQTIAFSFGLGILGAVAGSFTPYLDASVTEAALFGLTAAFIASGGWDGLKAAMQKGVSEAPLPPARPLAQQVTR